MNQSTPGKACTRCGEVKPPSEYHKRSVASDGLSSTCKPCAIAKVRAYKAANPEKVRESGKAWREANPGYSAANAKAWRQANPDKHRAYERRWAAENAERLAEAKRAWYEANREWVLSWPQRHPEASAERFRRHREKNRDARAEAERRRRVDRLGGLIEDVDLQALWTGECGICSQPLDDGLAWPHPLSKSIDHIIPLSRGGTHQASNLQWAHLRCNVSKGAKMPNSAA